MIPRGAHIPTEGMTRATTSMHPKTIRTMSFTEISGTVKEHNTISAKTDNRPENFFMFDFKFVRHMVYYRLLN